ncbi:efflux transporter outer membrane subunit [Pseudoalteromonas shioyasakiensis]|uniref:efflux transporter outer membrane subunit n=1 Tax=Pseudoalteromonas shioyasakiensis TaxID=1190813 RepID=UPI002117B491|nr:efflux transporter outer membrane subunit [Pseudoalteromonas shioyasakiensis]MCQ8879939.1 efflux transporter outer membrane subunit [Pseudoalteromonas shioyasakiensis]
MYKHTLLVSAIWLSGCAVGPDFEAPEHDDITTFMSSEATVSNEALLGWQQVYQDPHLQKLIQLALENNHDMLVARSRIIEARLNSNISDANLWPNANIGLTSEREKENGSSPANTHDLKGYLSWEVDLFGANRRVSEAALASYYATEQGKNAIQLALIADIAEQFFALKEIQEELLISQNTIELREKELKIARIRKAGGIISGLEQRQAEVELESAKVNVPKLRHQEHVMINQLRFLIADSTADVSGGGELSSQVMPKALPTGLPSELLKRRPDVQQAMLNWHSAMAEIGVAKADLFPKFNLYAEFGRENDSLDNILSANSLVWLLGGELLMPIFNMGKNLDNLSAAQERAYQASVHYEKAVLVALQEVSDQISSFQSSEQIYDAQHSLVLSSKDYYRLASLRYNNGVASSLDLLDAQRQLFSAEIALAQAKNNRLQSMARLYKALGGGWYETNQNEINTEKVTE